MITLLANRCGALKMPDHFKSINFRRYKTFRNFSIHLDEFNVLVGPNNSGKSTIIGAFRLLAEGLRKARSRKPEYLAFIKKWGYRIPLVDIPIATENIFTDYDDAEPATVEFTLGSGNRLQLFFPENNSCYLVPFSTGKDVKSTSDFKNAFDVSIGFVPVLGPVEHNESLYQIAAARSALLTHRASRNFRNIWYHYPEEFASFSRLIEETWPGMEIEKPVIEFVDEKPMLFMFCKEARISREIYWAGFGFQVWCQMLTFILRSHADAILIIDEPDIYLHSDLQRQLVGLLREAAPDVLLATHSTEIISEAEPHELLVVRKGAKNASRVRDVDQLRTVFANLGSNLNPVLTQLAKTRKAVFVEGEDFKVIAAIARKLKIKRVANRGDFAVIPANGFNPIMVKNFKAGIESTVGKKIDAAIVFDRDYRSVEEIGALVTAFKEFSDVAHIHSKKEIENYILVPSAIKRAVAARLESRRARGAPIRADCLDTDRMLSEICEELRSTVLSQHISFAVRHSEERRSGQDRSTVTKGSLDRLEAEWKTLDGRLALVPGKEVLAQLNSKLQAQFGFSISMRNIIDEMAVEEISDELRRLIRVLDDFGTRAS